MTDKEMVNTLFQLCNAYATNDRSAVAQLEPQATTIAQELDARGGMPEMRRVYKMIPDVQGKRTLEMHWDGIGDWRG